MINRLKQKFILINMSLVCLVLMIVFTAIGLYTYDRAVSESYMAMDKAISRDAGMKPPVMVIGDKPRDDKHGPLVPVFSVLIDENQAITPLVQDNVSISESLMIQVTEAALQSKQQTGILWNYELRYLVRNTPDGTKIAFADRNRELETLFSMLGVLLLTGLGALAAFGAISLYLAKWALSPVEKAWEQQKQFVADASHELKTPLTVILANTDILLAHKQEPVANQVKWIENTKAEAQRMKQLVEDLLFLAKYDSDHRPEMTSEMNLSDTLWRCILPFESVAYERGIQIETHIEPDLKLQGSESQIQQLTAILMDNACKYAGVGGIITATLKRQADQMIFSVHNTGAAIDPEHQKHIFDRFYRADSARTRESGGYGLGLAIASTIVEVHSGQIEVMSNEQKGTTFTITFPVKE